MVQDFNEYINSLNQYARQSGIRPGVNYFEPRPVVNPNSMFSPQMQANDISKIYPSNISNGEQVIQEAVGKSAKKGITKAGIKTALKYAPLTGDVYDIYRGTSQAFNGHPYAGTAQALLGTAGVLTLGGGSLAKSAGKAGVKWVLKKGIGKEAIRNTNKAFTKGAKITSSPRYQLLSAVAPEIAYGWSNTKNKKGQNNDIPPSETTNSSQGFEEVNELNNLPPINYPTIEEIIASGGNNQLPIGNNQGEIPIEVMEEVVRRYGNSSEPQSISSMVDYQKQLLEKNRPYIEGLENYYKNYQTNLDEANRIKRYFTGLAGWSGNDKWAELANDYNPLNIEANKLALVKQLQEANTGNLDEINRIIGNIAIARDLGLPDEAALASKELLNARAAQQKNLLGYNARVYDTNVDNATRMAIKQGDWDTAFKLQEMKNQGNLNNAFASSAPFYMDPATMAEVMKTLGVNPKYTPARGLNKEGMVQRVQPSINYFSGYNN